MKPELIIPDWPAPANVRAISSTRAGGCSAGVYTSLNLGAHVGDTAQAVHQNRQIFTTLAAMPANPVWLNQTHSSRCISLSPATADIKADASFSNIPGLICTVMTADCLPILLCNRQGTEVAAVHAGWRGLADGVIENALQQFREPAHCLAWLGSAISQSAFEVGNEVRAAFVGHDQKAATAFIARQNDKWLADLYLLARQRLAGQGVKAIYGGGQCTYRHPDQFFSYRRDGQTGRMASAIWLE